MTLTLICRRPSLPRRFRCRVWLMAGLALTLWGSFCLAQEAAVPTTLSLSTGFPGGSAEVRSLNPETGEIHIHPTLHDQRGWPCWWYFRLDGLKPGQKLTLKVSSNPRTFRGSERLDPSWSQPNCAALSTDNVNWEQTSPGRKQGGVATYEIEAPAERIWLAWGPPFVPSHTEELLGRIAEQLPGSERFVLARTLGDRPVHGIKIGGGTEDAPARYGIWAHARQHAWEAGSSWVAKGFLEWVASDDPAAIELRRTTTIHVVPIMDVDNVTLGSGGKEAVPRDHNRDWADEPVYPEVVAAQQHIRALNDAGKLNVYLDLHNPGAREPRPYFFAPAHLKQFPPEDQENYARWLAYCVESMRGPLAIEPAYKFATYVRSDEERRRMSKEWVRDNTSPQVIALTLETAWNTPHSTQEGYQIVGQQLAEATARYLSGLPAGEEKEPTSNR